MGWRRQSPHPVDLGKYLRLTDWSLAAEYRSEACRRTHVRPRPKTRHADRIPTCLSVLARNCLCQREAGVVDVLGDQAIDNAEEKGGEGRGRGREGREGRECDRVR